MLDYIVAFATLIILNHGHFIEPNIMQILRCFNFFFLALIDEYIFI
jgi:hypothetical protein